MLWCGLYHLKVEKSFAHKHDLNFIADLIYKIVSEFSLFAQFLISPNYPQCDLLQTAGVGQRRIFIHEHYSDLV